MKEVWGFAASSGGAKGAWSGGVSEYLINNEGRDYKYLSGSSTGSLIIPFIALKKIEELKEGYTSVKNSDIYTLSPYKIKYIDGRYKSKISYLKVAWNVFARKKKTFGDSTKLRSTVIPKFFREEDFEELLLLDKEILSAVTNLTSGEMELKSSRDKGMTYNDMCDWIYASTCAAPIMSILNKNGNEYADGAYTENVPIQALIDKGCTHIDVISLSPPRLDEEHVKDPLHIITRLFDIMMFSNAISDLQLSKLKAAEQDVILNIYKPGRKMTNNSLIFDKELMTNWWNEGYNFARDFNHEVWELSKKKKPKKIL